MDNLDDLPPRYTTILCDLWGCVHDGNTIFPGVVARLERWRGEGRRVLFVTNAPRSAAAIARQLAGLGLPIDLYDGIATAGDTGAACLAGRTVGFLGTPADRSDLEGRGLRLVDSGFAELACAGIEDGRPDVADYEAQLAEWAAANVLLHCLNPDRVVIHIGQPVVCAGALADRYEQLGGRVIWYGKPFPAIYAHALKLAGDLPHDRVVAVGDGLQTDVLGAARAGIDLVFVTGGINHGAGYPADFADRNGLGDWAPVMVVPGL